MDADASVDVSKQHNSYSFYTYIIQGPSQDFVEGGAILYKKEGAKSLIFSRAAPTFGWPEACVFYNDVIINLSAKLSVA